MNPNSMTFDPAAFLDMPVDVPLERRPPLPARDYIAVIQEATPRQWTSKDKYDDQGNLKSGIAVDIVLCVQIPLDIKEAVGLKTDTLNMRDSLMIDRNAQGGIDTAQGSNRDLRKYRIALDMNKPGETFRFSQMLGKMLLVRIKHEVWNGDVQERIDTVAALAA